jgi:arylformamidase
MTSALDASSAAQNVKIGALARDWDDAYRNAPYVKNGDRYAEQWAAQAAAFRADYQATGMSLQTVRYGSAERETCDLFLPKHQPVGVIVYVHGGYWKAFDRENWSHLASGALAHRLAFAIPSYTLCPHARVSDIANQVARAIELAAAHVAGPIGLIGHSAGGQLVARLSTTSSPLAASVTDRIAKVLAISGVHDLRPLQRTEMNNVLRIDDAEALAESPVLLRPRDGLDITCWVGGDERPEFIRQNAALAMVWGGFDVQVSCVVEPGRNHFDVIEALIDPHSTMMATLVGRLVSAKGT